MKKQVKEWLDYATIEFKPAERMLNDAHLSRRLPCFLYGFLKTMEQICLKIDRRIFYTESKRLQQGRKKNPSRPKEISLSGTVGA